MDHKKSDTKGILCLLEKQRFSSDQTWFTVDIHDLIIVCNIVYILRIWTEQNNPLICSQYTLITLNKRDQKTCEIILNPLCLIDDWHFVSLDKIQSPCLRIGRWTRYLSGKYRCVAIKNIQHFCLRHLSSTVSVPSINGLWHFNTKILSLIIFKTFYGKNHFLGLKAWTFFLFLT